MSTRVVLILRLSWFVLCAWQCFIGVIGQVQVRVVTMAALPAILQKISAATAWT